MMQESKAMQAPNCELCGKRTRLVGLERHADYLDVEVQTFNCDDCEHCTAVEEKVRAEPGANVAE